MSIYVTYLTSYFGSKLPPFYIGSTSLDNINSGYLGSAVSKKFGEIWKSEIKNNPHLFKVKIISRHLTRKEAYEKESILQKLLKVTKNNLYTNQRIANTLDFTYISRKGIKRKNPKPTNRAVAKCPKSGKSLGSVSLLDPRWKTKEIVSIFKGRIAPNKGTKQSPEYIEKRIMKIRGRKSTIPKGDHPMAKNWKLILPDGTVYESIGDLLGICEKLNLNYSSIAASANNGPISNVPFNYAHKNNPEKLLMRTNAVGIIVLKS